MVTACLDEHCFMDTACLDEHLFGEISHERTEADVEQNLHLEAFVTGF